MISPWLGIFQLVWFTIPDYDNSGTDQDYTLNYGQMYEYGRDRRPKCYYHDGLEPEADEVNSLFLMMSCRVGLVVGVVTWSAVGVALMAFAWGGLMHVVDSTAGGDRAGALRNMITSPLVGLLIAFLAYVLATLIYVTMRYNFDEKEKIALDDIIRMRGAVMRGVEKMFNDCLSVTVHGPSERKLEEYVTVLRSIFTSVLAQVDELRRVQGKALRATMPLCENPLRHWSIVNTTTVALLFPFSLPDLDTREGTLVGVDVNARSLVTYDMFNSPVAQNMNMAILATSGAGKSFSAKLVLVRELTRGVRAYIVAPEGEYVDSAIAAGGRVLTPGVPGQGMEPLRRNGDRTGADGADTEPGQAAPGDDRAEARCHTGRESRQRDDDLLRERDGGWRTGQLVGALRASEGDGACARRDGQPLLLGQHALPAVRWGHRPSRGRAAHHGLQHAADRVRDAGRRRHGLHRDCLDDGGARPPTAQAGRG